MAVNNPQFQINVRKNLNLHSSSFGNYYPKAVEKETISLRGLCKHMAEHQSIYGRDIIEGVLKKMASCVIELLSQGNPVKLDGLGIFSPTVQSTKNGISEEDLKAGKWNPASYVKAVHIRFRPEGVSEDNITSRIFRKQCALTTYGVEEKVDLTPEVTEVSQKKYIKRVTPLADWLKEQDAEH